MTDEDVLRLYEKHWYNYTKRCNMLHASCMYFKRHWLQRQLDSGRRDLYEINVVCYT
jgi:hypothetical protein